MTPENSLELLNATHQFPCAFMIKIIGVSRDDFVMQVVEAIQLEVGPDRSIPHTIRHTPAGRHTSVTLEPEVDSAEQVLAIYERIRAIEGVVLSM